MNLTENQKVFAGKIAAFGVGIVAIILGIVFRGVNVSFLVGWAFAVAASANLPAILMLLFWKRTTAAGNRRLDRRRHRLGARDHPDGARDVRRPLRADGGRGLAQTRASRASSPSRSAS